MDDIELILYLLSYFDKLPLCKLMSTEECICKGPI